ncbi:MAG: histidinol dehydrogenase [Candidatus Omnitrophica bacterium]|nr:histidinol dehydrogenase [Candidatus Omnitrophota bacterium]
MKIIRIGSREYEKIINRSVNRNLRIENRVRQIIEDVRLHGDEAVLRYTRRFDRVKLTPKMFRVSQAETSGAYQNISPKLVSQLKVVIENVSRFYRRQTALQRSWKIRDEDGMMLGKKISAIDTVGVYIPSGQVPLVSTVYMTVIPAQIAGVRRIIMATPPKPDGSVDPHILVVANLLKVDEIYKSGGAQAIAALSFGTKTIPRVDKIVGPGNDYVTEAKRQLFGVVDIDMVAGPSEVVIVANDYSNPTFVMSDLLAQAEHAMGLAILVTTSKRLARFAKKGEMRGYIIVVRNTDEAIEVVNQIAPEHLEILIKNPNKWVKKVRHAGAIFLGPYSPVVVGDYYAGPSHVLPTRGTARFFSGLSVSDFMKSSTVISLSRRALEKAVGPIEEISKLESLKKHYESVKIRFDQKEVGKVS